MDSRILSGTSTTSSWGEATLANMPMNKPELPVLWIRLPTNILPLIVTVIYKTRRETMSRTKTKKTLPVSEQKAGYVRHTSPSKLQGEFFLSKA
jgi:hypothetical protein